MKKYMIIVVALLSVGIFVYLYVRFALPLPSALTEAPAPTTKIVSHSGLLLYELLAPHQGRSSMATLPSISPHLIHATIAAEDARFYKHGGVDWRSILRALFQNMEEQTVVSGASTITQQLVRNTVGTTMRRTLKQKIKEALYAIRITQQLEKDTILEMYLNRVYYGNHNYGVEAAARGYFDKTARDLDLAEAAFLAGLPQAPNHYDPFEHFDVAKKRQERVLSRMVSESFITEDDAAAARDEQLILKQGVEYPVKAPHFVNYIIQELQSRLGDGLYDGLTVYTTLDYGLQSELEALTKRHIERLADWNVSNGAVLVVDAELGDIKAMVGSVDFFNKDIEGEVNSVFALRQPGSTMKPFTYALAFEKGWNGATIIQDEPVRYETAAGTPYIPRNFDFEYHGSVRIREALANSYNIPALKTLEFVGVPALLERVRTAGLSTLTEPAEHYGLALTLGDGEVRLFDLVQAYSAFARNGEAVRPRAITRITQNGGAIGGADEIKTTQVYTPEIAFMITDILSDSASRIEEFGLKNNLELSRPAAVKTGTTRNFKDAWTIGFTPSTILGVWVGNNNGAPMETITGGLGASPLWHDAMERVHRGLKPAEFVVPTGVEKRPACYDTVAVCEEGFEWFLKNDKHMAQVPQEALLRIIKPFNSDEFELSSYVEGNARELLFEAASTATMQQIKWFIDGKPAGTGRKIWWKPQRGQHIIHIEAEGQDGVLQKSAPITITVN